MKRVEVHGFRAVPVAPRCTAGVHLGARGGAPFFVHLNNSRLCTAGVHQVVHGRGCSIGIPECLIGIPEPVMHASVHAGRISSTASLRRLTLTYRTTEVTTDRARGEAEPK